jgi:uncharacterized protein (TIGR00255 family)
MTAFAREERRGSWGQLTWELRSVNHRYLEVSPRLPEGLRVLESIARERVARRLGRGKIELGLRYVASSEAPGELVLNLGQAEQLLVAARQIESMLASPAPVSALEVLRWPGVTQQSEPDLEAVQAEALSALEQALVDLVAAREREGEQIHSLLAQRSATIAELVRELRVLRPQLLDRQRERLLARLAELPTAADPGRLEQEMVLLAQRLDVEEELDRLDAHLVEIANVLQREEPVGRRLDFLMQELNREANTLSSKSPDATSTRLAVDLKVLIEQMREQVQNVE